MQTFPKFMGRTPYKLHSVAKVERKPDLSNNFDRVIIANKGVTALWFMDMAVQIDFSLFRFLRKFCF